MRLIRSNRTENLADALAEAVRRDPLPPFEREAIVVQSRGMERWLTLALAERLGVWSNPFFPFPRVVIEQTLEDLAVGSAEQARRYDPDRLKWIVAKLLVQSAPTDLRAYLGEPTDDDRALRLAGILAEVFDRYVVFRPDTLRRWLEDDDPDWQAVLWRRVVGEIGPHDLSFRIESALAALRAGATGDLRFERLHLFSLETLPPLFLRFFSELSRAVPTTLYVLEPSSEYLGDLDPAPQLSLAVEVEPHGAHPLLASAGRLSRDFQQVLLEFDESFLDRADAFETPGRSTLLSAVQTDILELRGPPPENDRPIVDASDDSISIHACPGPMREAQVLHDRIREALEADPSLQPEDIAVMTPDLETYAPVFRAVFGQGHRNGIPYEVHDRRTREDAPLFDDFLAVLEVLDSRFSVMDLVRLMDAGSLREELRFSPEERSRLTELLAAAGVRWGIDAEHRAELEFPAEDLHTWRAGLGRLFLGFASMPDAMEVFQGLLPRGAPSLGDAALVARLSRLCSVLFDLRERVSHPLYIRTWVTELERLANLLFEEDEDTGAAVRTLRATLQGLEASAAEAGYEGSLSLRAMRREIGLSLAKSTPPVGFLRRGVTLTELVPLRSVPFRVLCLVGMGEETFPRNDERPAFDETRKRHRPGDRSKRHDDRHSFLQAILCARDRLIITYSAPTRGLHAEASPSPLVWELCETVNRYYQAPERDPLSSPVVHPLHAFDARYFDGEELPQSFSDRQLQIARALREAPKERPRIELETEPTEPKTSLSVGELASWLWSPAKAFLDRVVRARFDTSAMYEPRGALTEISRLDAAVVGNGALRAGLQGEALAAYLEAAPEFPDGSAGRLERRSLRREIEAFHGTRRALESGHALRSERIATTLGDLTVSSRLDGLAPHHRIVERFTRAGRKGELTTWLEHLLMQAAPGGPRPEDTHVVLRGARARPCVVSFRPVKEPARILGDALELYRACLRAPLPIFEQSSRTYAESLVGKAGDRAGALRKAREKLARSREWDPRLDYLLGPEDPFDDADWAEGFEQAALTLYEPLLAHRSER